MSPFFSSLYQIALKPFAKNTAWMFMGMVLKTGIQFFYFIIVARALEPEYYGIFSGALAYVLIFSPFVSWGSGQILIKYVSRHSDSFPKYWGMTLGVSFISALLIFGILFIISTQVFSMSIITKIIVPLALGDFLGEKFSQLASFAFLAHQKIAISSLLGVISAFYRLTSAIIMLIFPIPKTAESWALLYMGGCLLAGLTGLLFVRVILGWGKISINQMKGEWKQGFFFSVGISAQGTYNDIDKTLMLRLGSATEAGIYAVAYRIIDSAFIPTRAILNTAYPRFFKEGEKGVAHASSFSIRLLPWGVGISLLTGSALLIFAPLIPTILGIQYVEAVKILFWLSPLIVTKTFHFLAADAITGAGHQGMRSVLQTGIALINITLNLFWIPKYGWLGAVWSSLLSDALLAIIMWGVLLKLKNRKEAAS